MSAAGTPWVERHPAARKPFFARWKQLWARRLASGAYAAEEEDSERRSMMEEVTGKCSLTELDGVEYHAAMMMMGAELHPEGGDPWMKDPEREAKVRKIQHQSPGDAYLDEIARRTTRGKVKKWRALSGRDIHKLMLTMETRDRKARAEH